MSRNSLARRFIERNQHLLENGLGAYASRPLEHDIPKFIARAAEMLSPYIVRRPDFEKKNYEFLLSGVSKR